MPTDVRQSRLHTNRSRRRRRDFARGPGLPPGATIAARAALKDIGGRMSETENGAPTAPDKAMQHALLKEKRAHETCERLGRSARPRRR